MAAFAETVVADVLYLVDTFGPLALSIWLGMLAYRRSRLTWLGWAVGIVAVFGIGWIASGLFDGVPGVGWRIRAMREGDGL